MTIAQVPPRRDLGCHPVIASVPEGRLKDRSDGVHPSLRDGSGFLRLNPTLKRWATLVMSLRDKSPLNYRRH